MPMIFNDAHISQFQGIGEYDERKTNRDKWRIASCVGKIALHILFNHISLGLTALIVISCPLSAFVAAPAALTLLARSFYKIWENYKELTGLKHIAPSTHALIPREEEISTPQLNAWDDTALRCLPFEDCQKAFECKKLMIENAEQEILISGSYCGGTSFDQILDAIKKRMEERKELRVHILSSTRFITKENQDKISELSNRYPTRFFTVYTHETHQANPNEPGFKFISNHAKMVIIDRKAMVTGGSAIEDRWTYSSDLIAPEFKLKQSGFINSMLSKSFLDKDFLIYAQDNNNKSLIDRSALEYYKLFSRWHHYAVHFKHEHPKIQQPTFPDSPGSSFYKNLAPNLNTIPVQMLTNRQEGFECARMKLFMPGPEKIKNNMEKELISLIENSKKTIKINHMYFHPTKALKQALANAANRGVKIQILTNYNTPNSPKIHKIFGDKSIFHVRKIARQETKNQKNITLFYWDIKDSTNHQKYILIDDQYTLCGSSNFGYKGFNSMSDYEQNVLIDSQTLNKDLKNHFVRDLKNSKRFCNEKLRQLPSLYELFFTAIHNLFEKKIG